MTTTKLHARWTNLGGTTGQPALDIVVGWSGDYADEYNLHGAAKDLLTEIRKTLPKDWHLAANGDLYGPYDADQATVDQVMDAILRVSDEIDLDEIMERHDRTTKPA